MDPEEKQWVQSTANELNNLLLVISESAQFLQPVCNGTEQDRRYFSMLKASVERATAVTDTMLVRLGHGTEARDEVAAEAIAHRLPEDIALEPAKDSILARIINPDGPRELIMIVDDEQFVTMLAQRVLTDEGYRIVTAKDGFECLDLYRQLKDQVSLIILDFTMPIMDGAEVFEELREINPRVAVVLSSGFAEQGQLRGMLAKGLRGFIPKPYTQQKLLQQIRSTLDGLKAEA